MTEYEKTKGEDLIKWACSMPDKELATIVCNLVEELKKRESIKQVFFYYHIVLPNEEEKEND